MEVNLFPPRRVGVPGKDFSLFYIAPRDSALKDGSGGACRSKRSLESSFEHNPREIGSALMKYGLRFIGQAFHRAGAGIGQKDRLWMDARGAG